MEINKFCVVLFIILINHIDIGSASEIGIQPNVKGDTIINQNTTWDGSNIYCGGNVTIGNSSQKIDFIIRNSHVTVNGKWVMGGNNPVNFTLINSTILFDVENGISTLQPQNAIINTTQAIIVEDPNTSPKASNITLKNSIIKGKDYSHLAGGLIIKSGSTDPKANHTVTVDNVTFEYMGGLTSSGQAYYAFHTGQSLNSNSILTNISLNYCGRGMALCSNIGASNVTSNGGYLAFIDGKHWNHLYMNKTNEGLYNPSWNAWISNSYFDAGETKLNIMSSSNVIFENNTVVLAAFNAGDGSYDNQGNNNTLINNEFIKTGIASRKNGTKILNNTFYKGMPSGGDVPIRMWGFNFSVMNNQITEGSPGILIQPHVYYKSAGGHLVQNNVINRSSVGISIVDEYDNKFINNTIKNTFVGAGIQIKNSTNQIFYDTSITNTGTYNIYLLGGNDNITFINTNFNDDKIGFYDSADVLKNYYYLDVQVVDSNGNKVSGATANIKNNIDDFNYKSMNINCENKTSSITKENGHTPPLFDKNNSIILLDYWQNKTKRLDMTYSITATKDGHSVTVTDINPNQSWYRPDPNVPTFTITAIIPDDSNGPHITGFAPSTDNSFNRGDQKIFRVWTDENLTEMNWTVDGKQEVNGALNYTWNVTEGSHKIEFSGRNTNGSVNQVWNIGGQPGDNSPDDNQSPIAEFLPEKSQNETIVRITPEYLIVSPGKPFSLSIWIEPTTEMIGAQFDLFFKDLMAKVDTIKEGNLFSQKGASTYFSNGTVDSNVGQVRHIYGSILGESNVSSPGTMAVINLTAGNSTGIIEFNLSNVIISDANSSRLPNSVNNCTVLIDTAPEMDIIGSKSVDETENLTFTVNAKDVDNDKLVFSASGLPNGASIDPATGIFTWTPSKGQASIYTIAFKVSDGYLNDSEDVKITVKQPNNAPSITSFEPANGSVFNEGDKIKITLNTSDTDGQALSYTIKIDGTIYSSSPSYVWDTNYSSSGSHKLELTASDGILDAKRVNTIYINDSYPRWDVNKDGVVDIRDVTIVSRKHGTITKAPYHSSFYSFW